MPHDSGPMMAMGAWIAMMLAMMLPSLSPRLWAYHCGLAPLDASRAASRTMLFGSAYAAVWAAVSAIAFVCDNAARQSATLLRIAPVATAAVIVGAGAMQLTRWKARHLAHCRGEAWSCGRGAGGVFVACRDGARLGLHCTASCAGYTAILLVPGAMSPGAMLAVTAAITAERVLPAGTRVARLFGGLAICAGIALLQHAVFAGSASP